MGGSASDEKHIATLFNERVVSDPYDATQLDYGELLQLVESCAATRSSPLSAQWNQFRYNLVGAGRVDGALRILYRYDGWPEPQTLVVAGVDTEGKNKLALQAVLRMIGDETGEKVEYQELRCAVNPTFVPGRRGWEPLDTKDVENERVPLLLSNDGTLEVDVWLRTKGFIENRTGKPLP